MGTLKNKLILFESDEYFTEKLPLNEVEISLKDGIIPYYREFGSQYQQLPSRRIDVNKIDFLIDDLYKTKSKNKLQLNSSEVDDAIYFHANFNKIKIKKKLENENELSTFSDFISDIFPLASQNKHDIKKSNDNYVFFPKIPSGTTRVCIDFEKLKSDKYFVVKLNDNITSSYICDFLIQLLV